MGYTPGFALRGYSWGLGSICDAVDQTGLGNLEIELPDDIGQKNNAG